MKIKEEQNTEHFIVGLIVGLLIWFFAPNSVSNVNQTKIKQATEQCENGSFKTIKIYGSVKYLGRQNEVEVKCSNGETVILEHPAK